MQYMLWLLYGLRWRPVMCWNGCMCGRWRPLNNRAAVKASEALGQNEAGTWHCAQAPQTSTCSGFGGPCWGPSVQSDTSLNSEGAVGTEGGNRRWPQRLSSVHLRYGPEVVSIFGDEVHGVQQPRCPSAHEDPDRAPERRKVASVPSHG